MRPTVPLVSITLMPRIEDGEDGWYAVIGGQRLVGPCTEAEADYALEVIMGRAGWRRF